MVLVAVCMCVNFTACEGRLDNGEDNGEDNGGTPFIPEISIARTYCSFSAEGGDSTIKIDANFEYNVSAQSSWVTAEKVYEGILIAVSSNPNTSSRSAIVIVYNKEYGVEEEIKVYQSARDYRIGDIVTKGSAKGVVFEAFGSSAKMISIRESDTNLTWNNAKQWCSNLGSGWRLPTKDELLKVHSLKSTLNITCSGYWTSTSTSNDGKYIIVWSDGSWGRDWDGSSAWACARAVYDLW